VGSANAVVEYDFEGDSFWMAVEDEVVAPTLTFGVDPDPCLGDPDDLEGNAPNELHFAWDGPDNWLREKIGEIEREELVGAMVTPCKEDDTPRVKLYDSGATCHISPYKSNFTAYSQLSPLVFLNTANQQQFPAVGTGTLAIQVPNGQVETELCLKGALHVPSIGYTLVTLDEEGYCTQIDGRYLEITSLYGDRIG